MGIYWCAIDRDSKEKIKPPINFSIKAPCFFHPTNPFPNMVIMMNCYGYNFELINDCDWEGPYYDSEYKDITEEVYIKYLEIFPWAKDEIYELKDNLMNDFKHWTKHAEFVILLVTLLVAFYLLNSKIEKHEEKTDKLCEIIYKSLDGNRCILAPDNVKCFYPPIIYFETIEKRMEKSVNSVTNQ